VRARRVQRAAWRGLRPAAVQETIEARRFCARYADRTRPVRKHRIARESRLDLLPATLDLEDGLIVDLGANVGDWTAAVLEVAPRARVLAVEPAPEPRRRLEARFGGDPRVSIDSRAVAARAGAAEFFITRHSHNSSMRRPRASVDDHYGAVGAWNIVDRIEVPVTTVDELVGNEDVAVLKIDVQGLEREALSGARGTLERAGGVLVEVTFISHYDGDATFPWLHEHLTQLGFDLVGLSEPFTSTQGALLWMDACYAPGLTTRRPGGRRPPRPRAAASPPAPAAARPAVGRPQSRP
jgi:FkbM family methyltransferase